MRGNYGVLWVGDKAREWTGANSSRFIDYTVKCKEPDGVERQSVITRKEGGRPAPVVGQVVYGHIEEERIEPKPGQDFEAFTKRKLKEDQLENGGGPRSGGGAKQNDLPPEFWAARDKRLARAGMTQAVVTGTAPPMGVADDAAALARYVAQVNNLVDALLAALDERAPSPNNDADVGGGGLSESRTSRGLPDATGPAAPDVSAAPISDKQRAFLDRLLTEKGANADDAAVVRSWAAETLTGGQNGSASKALDGLMANPAETLTRLIAAAYEWSKTQTDAPADTSGFSDDFVDDGTTPF